MQNTVILGDSGFPIRKWLLVPYLHPTNQSQKAFNTSLCKCRSRVEHSFGQMKRRFAINHQGYRCAIERVPNGIMASLILHNIAVDLKMPEIEEPLIGEEDGNIENLDNEHELEQRNALPKSERSRRLEGVRMRQELTTRFA